MTCLWLKYWVWICVWIREQKREVEGSMSLSAIEWNVVGRPYVKHAHTCRWKIHWWIIKAITGSSKSIGHIIHLLLPADYYHAAGCGIDGHEQQRQQTAREERDDNYCCWFNTVHIKEWKINENRISLFRMSRLSLVDLSGTFDFWNFCTHRNKKQTKVGVFLSFASSFFQMFDLVSFPIIPALLVSPKPLAQSWSPRFKNTHMWTHPCVFVQGNTHARRTRYTRTHVFEPRFRFTSAGLRWASRISSTPRTGSPCLQTDKMRKRERKGNRGRGWELDQR